MLYIYITFLYYSGSILRKWLSNARANLSTLSLPPPPPTPSLLSIIPQLPLIATASSPAMISLKKHDNFPTTTPSPSSDGSSRLASPPVSFLCCINHHIMSKPVCRGGSEGGGRHYEEETILRWIREKVFTTNTISYAVYLN